MLTFLSVESNFWVIGSNLADNFSTIPGSIAVFKVSSGSNIFPLDLSSSLITLPPNGPSSSRIANELSEISILFDNTTPTTHL